MSEWEEAKTKTQEYFSSYVLTDIWDCITNLIEAGDKEIARLKKSHERNQQVWMKSIEECHKEIARLEQRIKELGKDSCAVCFNDGRNQALEEAANVAEKKEYERFLNVGGPILTIFVSPIAEAIRALKEEQ